jgi:hypothetical protein
VEEKKRGNEKNREDKGKIREIWKLRVYNKYKSREGVKGEGKRKGV